MRFFIDIAYDGSSFHGWQKQPNASTVQEIMERQFRKIFKESVELVGAGRTDTGVHARQLLAHFDRETIGEVKNLIYKLNRMLPKSIAVNDLYRVTEAAHARFDARSREYHYQVSLHKDPFKKDYFAFCPYPLNVQKMNEAGEILKSYCDFQSFSKVKTDVKTYICRIDRAEWVPVGKDLIFIIKADRFLRNMVRAIVGTLLEIGRERLSLSEFREVIACKNRSAAGTSVPAKGLFLHKIEYPDSIKFV